ncbi:MAG: LacI family DNA-binding transcriptional regulator [Eubacteriales bacterium]
MVSIKDVAKQAGVAISTVSKVLNHYPNISKETREKVNKAIDELNYVPNSIAAALSSKQWNRIALIIHFDTQTKAMDEISMQYLSGAIRKAKEYKLDVVTIFFSMIKEMTVMELERYLQSQGIKGLIIYRISKEDMVLHELLKRETFKAVTTDALFVNQSTSTIGVDQTLGQYEVAKKTILDNSVKSVLYIAGKQNGYVTDLRLQGMTKVAKELSLELQIQYGEFSELLARKLTLAYGEQVDAVICASDLMAIGAMKALIMMDIFRPVCGYDGITLMGYVGKQMNTVQQNFAKCSEQAVKELVRLMNGGRGKSILLEHQIVNLKYEDIIC